MRNDMNGSDQKDDEMICALTADEAVELQRGLRALPETMPPRDVWRRIREQAEAEGLLQTRPQRTRRTWYLGAGIAAAAALVAIMMPGVDQPPVGPTTVPTYEEPTTGDLSNLRALMVTSQRLERDLRSLPAEPRVARAGTVATISEIENRIAAIDYQLNDPAAEWADGDKEIFWGERVRLMNLLLQLRYAQAQRAAY